MSTRALHSDAQSDSEIYWDMESGEDHVVTEPLYSGERICPPRARSNTMLSAAIILSVALGGGWALMNTRSMWEPLLPELASLWSAVERSTAGPAAVASTADAPSNVVQPPPQLPLESHEVAEAPGADAGIPVAPTTSQALAEAEAAPAATEDAGEAAAGAPLPPPTVDPKDPYQQRAFDVGLHPDLSRTLLTRMSAADYRNAGYAIRTALAKTTDGDVFVWPQKYQAKLAQFEVRFVKGAVADCRRYVVTVTKDRWSTTARPMEKCGVHAAAKNEKAASNL